MRRGSLLTRLLAVSLAITALSVGATAWIATLMVSRGIRQAQGQSHQQDARIYGALLRYAATHPSWHGVGPALAALSRQTGLRIVLASLERRTLARAGPKGTPAVPPTALVDPLDVDPAFSHAARGHIATAAIGPYAAAPREQAAASRQALHVLACVQRSGAAGRIGKDALGLAEVTGAPTKLIERCGGLSSYPLGPGQEQALSALQGIVNTCLQGRGLGPVMVNLDFSWIPRTRAAGRDPGAVNGCLLSARRVQLAPYVAPAALLFVSSRSGSAPTFSLSAHNQIRTIEIIALVLVLAVGLTVLAWRRLVGPLRALTAAARQITTGDAGAEVPVGGAGEIGELAAAFNEMVRVRHALEEERKAAIADIAHELRTPLANLRAWLEALRDGIADGGSELARSLLEETLQLQRIIDDLELLSLADAGRLRLHPEQVDVESLLAGIRDAHAAAAAHAGVTLGVAAAGALTLSADELRLRQAIQNLVSNALRHTPAGGTITLSAEREEGTVAIRVSDTGTGIVPADLPHLFDRFWRAEKSRSRAGGGSGLGLAIVREIVEAHGGAVSVTSTVLAGSTFTLRLPCTGKSLSRGRVRPQPAQRAAARS